MTRIREEEDSGELNATIFRHSNTQLQCSPYRSCHTDTITNTLNKDRQERTGVLGSMEGWHGDPRGRTLWRGVSKYLGTLCVTFYPKCRPRAPKCPNFSRRSKNFSKCMTFLISNSKLLIPVSTAQAKALVNCMSVKCMGKYSELKCFLHAEYKLTTREYKVHFDTTTKNVDETLCIVCCEAP